MQTSNFTKSGKSPDAVAICIGIPEGYTGARAVELAPTWKMLKNKYTKADYFELLKIRGLDPMKVYKKYRGKIMICYERNPADCHRSWLAEWIKTGTGIEVTEVSSMVRDKEKKNFGPAQMILF